MKNTVIANRKKGDWEIIKKYFEDRGVEATWVGSILDEDGSKHFYYGVIDGKFSCYSLKKAQKAYTTILEVSDIDKEFKVGDVVKVIKPCKTSVNKVGHIGKITDIRNGSLIGFGKCTVYQINGDGYEHISGIELVVSDTVTIPKSFVLEAHKSVCSDWKKRIEEVVPDLFPKNELIVGNWYKFKYLNWLGFIGKDFYYGFNNGNWFYEKQYCFGFPSRDYVPATEQEVFEALKNEAVKRGFKEGAIVNNSNPHQMNFKNNTLSKGIYSFEANQLICRISDCEYIVLFKEGRWAEVIVEPIPEELQTLIKKLGKDKIIEILNSN